MMAMFHLDGPMPEPGAKAYIVDTKTVSATPADERILIGYFFPAADLPPSVRAAMTPGDVAVSCFWAPAEVQAGTDSPGDELRPCLEVAADWMETSDEIAQLRERHDALVRAAHVVLSDGTQFVKGVVLETAPLGDDWDSRWRKRLDALDAALTASGEGHKATILGPTQEATCDRCGYHETLLASYQSIYCPRCNGGYCLRRHGDIKPGASTKAEELLLALVVAAAENGGDEIAACGACHSTAECLNDCAARLARAYLVSRGLLPVAT